MAPSPVSPGPTLAEAVRSLAYAATGDSAQAQSVREVFEQAAVDGGFAVLFRRWWQEKTLAPLPQGAIVAPWATAVHQQIADTLAGWQLLGQEPLLLPCPSCGRVFTSQPPRFARSCGRCKPYADAGKPNPDGSRLMGSTGLYPAGAYRPSQGQSILCAHPDCLRLVLASDGQRRYCDEHQRDRKAAARARNRTREPKHARVRFYPNSENGTVWISFGDAAGTERRLTIDNIGYQPQNDHELLHLLQLAHAGSITVRWT